MAMIDDENNPPATRDECLARLHALGIAQVTHDHAPIFTVAEGADIKARLAGGHTKNLFLKDKSGAMFLISALAETDIAINKLHPVLGCKRLSFGKADLLLDKLGVTPGSVTVFSVMNDRAGEVTLILDAALFTHDIVNFHPMKNDATTAIAARDMLAFVRAENHEPVIVDFNALQVTSPPLS